MFVRTGTANWLNNATANGNTNGAGPGVIQPPVQIVFSKLGGQYFTHGQGSSDLEAENGSQYWSSYDGSTNAPIIYPTQKAGTNQMTVRMWLIFGSNFNEYEWHPFSLQGAQFAMQTSTNLTGWTTLFTVSNNGSICTYFNAPASPTRFYQLVPQ